MSVGDAVELLHIRKMEDGNREERRLKEDLGCYGPTTGRRERRKKKDKCTQCNNTV
jgi:hypothetical protein